MAISYAQSLHNNTAFTLIQKNDGIMNMAWKIPAGRVAAATTFSFALIEALFATVLTALSSPLYIIDGRPFNSFSSETLDASKTALLATKRFVGLENPAPQRPIQTAPKAPPRSLEPKKPSLLSKAGNFALSNPNALFVVSALTAAAAGLYFFGVPSYFMNETAPTPQLNDLIPPLHNFTNTSNTCEAPIPTPTPQPRFWTQLVDTFTNTSNTCDVPISTPTTQPRFWTQLVDTFTNTSNTCDAPIPTPEPIEQRIWTQLVRWIPNNEDTCKLTEAPILPPLPRIFTNNGLLKYLKYESPIDKGVNFICDHNNECTKVQ